MAVRGGLGRTRPLRRPSRESRPLNRRSPSDPHEEATAAGRATYVDPDTRYQVFTAAALAARGYCCGSGCRHCPYDAEEQRRAGRPILDPPDT
ncbi:MAG TPA: DUF5522 domain-containing protein [Acidimicrobiales bacterium]|nr:DUF5522 domain-containing protein [Acidimicrobiales bacterium]